MSTTNYWNQMSGDSQASPWNKDEWATTDMGMNNPVDPNDPTSKYYGTGRTPTGSTPWMPTVYDDVSPNSPWYKGNGGFMENINNDRTKADDRWGAQGFSDAGVGYWSGGRPGAGSWTEQIAAAPAAAPAPATAPVPSPMVPGAQAQTPARTAPVAEPAPVSHWDTPYAGRYQAVNQMYDQYLDRDSEEGGWQGWENTIDSWFGQGMTGDQINQRLAHEFQSSPEYQQRVAAGQASAYTGTWGAPAAPAYQAPTNPWIDPEGYGGGGNRRFVAMR